MWPLEKVSGTNSICPGTLTIVPLSPPVSSVLQAGGSWCEVPVQVPVRVPLPGRAVSTQQVAFGQQDALGPELG